MGTYERFWFVYLHCPGWPRTLCVAQAVQELTDISFSLEPPWESPSSSYETDLYFPDLGFYGPEILSTGFWGWNKHIRTLHSHQCMPYHLSRNDSADKGTCCAGPRTWVQFSGPTVKGEAPLLGVFPWPPHVHHNTHTSWHVHVHTYTVHAYMHNNNNK